MLCSAKLKSQCSVKIEFNFSIELGPRMSHSYLVPSQAIRSAVAQFPSMLCTKSCLIALSGNKYVNLCNFSTGPEVRAPGGQSGDSEDFEAVQPLHERGHAEGDNVQPGLNYVSVQ